MHFFFAYRWLSGDHAPGLPRVRPRVLHPCRQCPGLADRLARRLALARPASCWLVPLARPAASGHKRRMAAYVLTAAAMSLPALGVLRCCCRRRVFTAASASLSTRPSVIIDTDCALDDLATLALAAATGTSLQLVTTVNGLAPPGHGHELVRLHGQKRLTWQRPSSAVCLLGAARHSPGR